jgi:hypothetical protein
MVGESVVDGKGDSRHDIQSRYYSRTALSPRRFPLLPMDGVVLRIRIIERVLLLLFYIIIGTRIIV